MDRITAIAGYWNLEFGGGSPNGKSGGVPGGMGSHNWGAWGQALYLGLTIGDIILTVVTLGGAAGIKAGLKGLMAAGQRALTSAARLLTREGLKELGTKILTRLVRLLPGRRSFFSVQGAEDIIRLLQRGGHPWPQGFTNGTLRDIFGQGLYTFASREQATLYLRMLEESGVSGLRLLEHSVSSRNFARFLTADLTRMTDEVANAILDLGIDHGFQHISRMTHNFGVEHFFSREVYPFFRSWILP